MPVIAIIAIVVIVIILNKTGCPIQSRGPDPLPLLPHC